MDRQNEEDKQKRISKRKALSSASHQTRAEVLKRRITNLNRLSYYLRAIYWLLLERMKNLYKRYIFNFKEPSSDVLVNVDHNSRCFNKCAFHGCERNHMPLTTFCYSHILFDPKQHLYKPCQYVLTSEEAGPITCGKPTLRSMVPCLCNVHMEEAKKHLNRTLEQAGVAISSTGDYRPPQFHVLVAELVNQIQAKRRAALRGNDTKIGSETKMIDDDNDD